MVTSSFLVWGEATATRLHGIEMSYLSYAAVNNDTYIRNLFRGHWFLPQYVINHKVSREVFIDLMIRHFYSMQSSSCCFAPHKKTGGHHHSKRLVRSRHVEKDWVWIFHYLYRWPDHFISQLWSFTIFLNDGGLKQLIEKMYHIHCILFGALCSTGSHFGARNLEDFSAVDSIR